MRQEKPQEPGDHTGEPKQRFSLSALPGVRTAAVAFVLTVLIGGGGLAIANWGQSATTTIDITAGAAPTPTPEPTQPPTVPPTAPPTVPPGSGTIVANPAIMALPAKVDAGTIRCTRNGSSGNITIDWPGTQTAGISYGVSLKFLASSTVAPQTQTVTQRSVSFSLENKSTAYGKYLLRIQPTNTATAVAGDPTYVTVRYSKDDFGCEYGASDGQPPLGAFAVSSEPMAPRPNDNLLKLSWTPTTATSYVVTIALPAGAPKYGAEFTTTTLGATVVFPPRVWNQAGTTVSNAAFFGQYSLRILPINGGQAGDPIYKTVQYGPYDLTVW